MEEALLERMRAHPAAKQQQVIKPSDDEPVVGKQAVARRCSSGLKRADVRQQYASRRRIAVSSHADGLLTHWSGNKRKSVWRRRERQER